MPDKDTASAPMGASLSMRAVACKRWRWLPGMAAQSDGPTTPRVLGVRPSGRPWMHDGDDRASGFLGDVWPLAPDLDDPATLGCLLALVREAWGTCVDIEEFFTNTGSHQFEVSIHAPGDIDDPLMFRGGSLASALVAALEAAP